MVRRVLHALPVALAALVLAGSASAAVHTFSYDAANAATRRVAGDLTFQFRQRLFFQKVLDVRSTEGRAAADLKPASERVLGRGGLSRLIGADAHERDLYEVEPDAQGAELIRAFCPGSTKAWLAFGRLAVGAPLRIDVLGDNPAGGGARLCQRLDFAFRGEWSPPPGRGVSERDFLVPHEGPY